MTKFLNISTDTTLGGNAPSDELAVSQKAIKTYTDNGLSAKQATLVSGTNIKTVNGTTLLGSGNITTTELPSQSGQSGKFLTTNGTTVSWATVGGGGSSTLSGLSDVTITSATSGQALTYDGSGWVNSTIYAMQIVDYTA